MKIIIVGAGISGLSTAYALLERDPGLELMVYESSERPGGKIRTDKTPEGFLCESGVPGFLDNKPKTLELSSGLELSLLRSFDTSRKRYIYSEGRLQRLPESPPDFFKSSLLSLPGRLRILYEIFAPLGKKSDETLAEFATRRLGREAFEKLIDPMASGIYAGDATKLSLKSCFPRIHEIEAQYGSLIKGLIKLQAKAKKEKKTDKPSAAPGGKLTSFADGMQVLISALAIRLGDRLKISMPVASISRSKERYAVHTANGYSEEADQVILAAPAHAQAEILRDIAPEISHMLVEIPYPPVSVCSLAYRKDKMRHDLDGFGFLIPSKENRKVLGTLWETSIFPNRAPEGYVLLRSMVGGARNSNLAMLPDEQVIDLVRAELKDIMNLDADPDFARVYRHEKAIPQYVVGHAACLEEIEKTLIKKYPGLILTGNAYKGVSLNDCVTNAYGTAEKLLFNITKPGRFEQT